MSWFLSNPAVLWVDECYLFRSHRWLWRRPRPHVASEKGCMQFVRHFTACGVRVAPESFSTSTNVDADLVKAESSKESSLGLSKVS
jgi:hypothetical protein